MFVVGPSGVSFSPATNAGMVASFRVSLGGKKVGATVPVKHARFGRKIRVTFRPHGTNSAFNRSGA